MAEKLGLTPGVRELKLGPTFTNPKSSTGAFHTLRYDFKPASVDVSKMATVDVGPNNTMTVTVPHLDGAGVPQTVFKGSQKPCNKECVLIVDKVTGEITLERLSWNIQVKKTRSETKTQQQVPNKPNKSPESQKSPKFGHLRNRKKKETAHQSPSKQKTLAKPSQAAQKNKDKIEPEPDIADKKKSIITKTSKEKVLSESSSSSSDSSGSSSESEKEKESKPKSSSGLPPETAHFLNDDLQLSESESDSD